MKSVFRNCLAIVLLSGFMMLRLFAVAEPGKGLKFIENKSQWPSIYDYGATIPGGSFFAQPGAFTYVFLDAGRIEQWHEQTHHGDGPNEACDDWIDGVRVRTNFIGANTRASVTPIDQNSDYTNYFIGANPNAWATGVRNYQALLYEALYPGIGLKIYSSGKDLKYDFVVEAGADPSVIRFSYDGIDRVLLNAAGDLEVAAKWPLFIEKKPVAFQYIDGRKVLVACQYELVDGVVSFQFSNGYDTCYPLVIDPLLIFSTYSGSTADNWGSTATPGERGTLYSAGVTWSNPAGPPGRFPATTGAFQLSLSGIFDIGILKYDSTGSQLLYATYLGGEQTDSPHSLVVNNRNELLVLGTTSSDDFPTSGTAYDRTFDGGPVASGVVTYARGADILITRLSGDGRQLLASTLLGGTSNDGLNQGVLVKNYGDQQRGDIITDDEGNVYVATVTASPEFPIVNGLYDTYGGGGTDAVLIKMNPELSKIIWSTFIGGSGTDACHTIKFDRSGQLFIAGGTSSPDFPVTAGSYQTEFNGVADGWIASITENGTAWQKATFTGTASFDEVFFVDLNEDDEVYVYGQTAGAFPVTSGVYSNPGSGQFIQKFDHQLTQLRFSTVVGSGRGIPDISPTAFLVNDCNNIYIAGWGGVVNIATDHWQNNTFGMPVTPDAFQRTTSGSDFYFMVLTDDATEFLYGTYLGGALSRTHVDGGTSRFDKGGIVYQAVCAGCASYNGNNQNRATSDFPTTAGVWSNLNRSVNCNNAAFKFDLSSLKARLQSNSIRLNQAGLNKICIPDPIVFQNFSTGGETFEWDLGDGTQLVKQDTSMVVHQYKNTGLYTVWLKAIDKGTCKVKDSASVRLNVYIADISVQEDDNVCQNTPYTLHASGGVSYFWRSADNVFQSNEQNPSVLPNDTTLYIVRVTEQSGCVKEDSVQLRVIPTIVPSFEFAQSSECFERPAIHVVSTTDSLWADDRLFFDFGDGVTSENTDIAYNYQKDGLYNLKLVLVRDECVTEKMMPLPIFQLKIPNVITPGKRDAANDNFVIQYGPVAGITPANYGFKTSVTIYNRWGVEVYHSDDYQYDWDGDGVEGGVYYYEVTVQNHATCKSWLHVVK